MPNLLLEADNITKYFGDRKLLDIENFKIYSGDRIGFIGQNGSGKTTFLRILLGEVEPDNGHIKRCCEISYVAQFGDTDYAEQEQLSRYGVADKLGRDIVSGGEATRLKLAAAVSRNVPLLFADEPTANLDFAGIELFSRELIGAESFILVSHDRCLLDKCCNRIIEIRSGKLHIYEGNYLFYEKQYAIEQERTQFEYEQYREEKWRLERALLERDKKAKTIKKAPSRMGNSEARLHKRSATEREEKVNNAKKAIETRLHQLEVKERPENVFTVKLDFSLTNPPQNKIIMHCEGLNFAYGDNVLFRNAVFEVANGVKTAIHAPNGAGKTTLLNLIAERHSAFRIAPKAKLGYFYQGFQNIDYNKTILENVMRDSVQNEKVCRTVLARLLFLRDDVYKQAGILSGGERIKLGFAKLLLSDANTLLLDEPTNYLDMASIKVLQQMLLEYEGTVVFVSHDRAFINAVADNLLIIEDKQVKTFRGNIAAYESDVPQSSKDLALERTMLQLKLSRTLTQLSAANEEAKQALEAEYLAIAAQIRELG